VGKNKTTFTKGRNYVKILGFWEKFDPGSGSAFISNKSRIRNPDKRCIISVSILNLVGDVEAGVKAEAAAQPLLVAGQQVEPCSTPKYT